MLRIDVGGHTTKDSTAAPVAVPVSASTTTAARGSSASALFRAVAALAVHRAVSFRLKRHRGGLATAGADHGCPRGRTATAAVTTTIVMGMMGSGITAASSAGTLFRLATRFAAARRGVPALLVKLLFACGEDKLLSAVATGE